MTSDPPGGEVLDITPDQVAELMPGSPLLSSANVATTHLELQRFQLPASRISLPKVRDNLIVIHLQGQVYVEEELTRGRRQRRWSERHQISITPSGESVTRLLKGRPDVLLVHLPDQLIKEIGSEIWDVDPAGVTLLQCLAEPDEHVSQIGRALQAEVHSPSRGTSLMTECLGRAMTLNLLRNYSPLSVRPEPKPVEMGTGRLNRVLNYMHEHLADQITLNDLAALSGLGATHFARSFRNSMGQSPHRYLVGLRIERARDLLKGSSLSIIEIGLMCGFNQSNHFSSMFRKNTGLSPRAWRLETRK